ncbi:NAD(P)H nitroreductase [Shewanella psychropiezotolerans]|uniref:Putative NAD(P)H nitroreductase n=1 Tax=Shewanella psychropiezotolerans TaxID=2593655 RepID=A0ABX5X100_9GAMM|nr:MULTISPECIES: NAD(P)H nitroreductase [Shewanella]MPY21741.1 NAD(P)H nitroreductase [Shewanella sp. YLB-07]QDO84678.1 NAD(P)H nitroreductase [Shewanella psychropiezotolerans]
MDATELLLTRQSCPRLIAPAPDESQLKVILDAGVRVPDHGGLSPWEFIIAQGEGLNRLGDIFLQAAIENGADEAKQAKTQSMPLRAPMIIVVVAKPQPHGKVPELEQLIAAGCSTMAMQQAAFSLGLGGIWRTGDLAFDKRVHLSLGLSDGDQIVGFLYLGTQAVKAPLKPGKSGSEFARYL